MSTALDLFPRELQAVVFSYAGAENYQDWSRDLTLAPPLIKAEESLIKKEEERSELYLGFIKALKPTSWSIPLLESPHHLPPLGSGNRYAFYLRQFTELRFVAAASALSLNLDWARLTHPLAGEVHAFVMSYTFRDLCVGSKAEPIACKEKGCARRGPCQSTFSYLFDPSAVWPEHESIPLHALVGVQDGSVLFFETATTHYCLRIANGRWAREQIGAFPILPLASSAAVQAARPLALPAPSPVPDVKSLT